ncbi:M23 family metallopeptidase [Sporosarcina sp. E16_3]|uniref:M23 family metallopeptidase n=1 Tax=Sporosarcina sp. E16_3 TaxID=2789293 RepID=UPI001A919BDB|nr:M23 family metallopeptidase [Sporosarcina sp. E16_3]MBO0602767.1 M23 family metallopeptidase [Sporosarcina sp. E16_3]
MSDFLRPTQGRVTSPFGPRTHPVTGKPAAMHWGVDFGKDAGTRIIAAAAGKVTYAKSTNGYGNTVMVLHNIGGKTYETVYAHLASIGVKLGQSVKAGEVIAVMGTTGTSTGVHLHFEVHTGRWNNRFTNAQDPMKYVGVPVSVPSIPVPSKPKPAEVIRMFNPSSATLKDAYTRFLADAIKAGHLSQKWADDFKAGKLSLDDALALKVIVDDRKK